MPAPILISGTYALIPHPEEAYSNSAQRPPNNQTPTPLQEPSYGEEEGGEYKCHNSHEFY